MRIVIDLQGAQTDSRWRGIGRYTLSFAQAVARNRGEHEVLLALNGSLPAAIESIRAAFHGLLPQSCIRVWQAPGPLLEQKAGNEARRATAELVREAFLASLRPDVIHISSMFEGFTDDAVTSIGRFDLGTPTTVTLYDLIPLLNPAHYFSSNARYEQYYRRKIEHLEHAAGCLAISEFSRAEGLANLRGSSTQFVNVSTAIEPRFQQLPADPLAERQLRDKFGLARPFVLYTGGDDWRKNLVRLIKAFAALPQSLRENHQLVLAGPLQPISVAELEQAARSAGLKAGTLRCIGHVSDDELVRLYNLCELFVFPSWHEGFGLPALEAMACGAPVIAANASSLPELVDFDAALFDPFDVAAISAKMAQALGDAEFRTALRSNRARRASAFSWDDTAARALAHWRSLLADAALPAEPVASDVGKRRPRLAFVSPMPPERSGIADYSAELLPALAAHYDIELVVAQEQVALAPGHAWTGERRDESWLRAHAHEIDRVLYHFGNSPFHRHMPALLRDVPGVVVMHDFFLSGMFSWLECSGTVSGIWTHLLHRSHGYHAVRERFLDIDAAQRAFPVNLEVLQRAQGFIVHSSHSRELIEAAGQDGLDLAVDVVPLLRLPAPEFDRAAVRRGLGIDEGAFLICSFGYLGPSKLNNRLLDAWVRSAVGRDPRARLVFIGEWFGGAYGAALSQAIEQSGMQDRISVTGFADAEMFRQYLMAADLAVQLRADSRGETSAAVLDCMNHGLAVVVNGNGAMSELDPRALWMLPDDFHDDLLVHALETLWREPKLREMLGQRAREVIRTQHAPAACASGYREAIERISQCVRRPLAALCNAIAAQDGTLAEADLLQLSAALGVDFPLQQPRPRLLLDVSATCRDDLRTGIQRVARALLVALLHAAPQDFRIEPVCLSDVGGFWHHRTASDYALQLLGCPAGAVPDELVEPQNGDVLLNLDLSGEMFLQASAAGLLAEYRRRGTEVHSVVFDLLPVIRPDVFPPGMDGVHARWLKAISELDGAFSISSAVEQDLVAWQIEAGIDFSQRRPFQLGLLPLGADINNSSPSKGLPANAAETLRKIAAEPSFLMVGTIEPRKGHAQALSAFELLWAQQQALNLVIVGKPGWMVEPLISRMRSHPRAGQRLFWLESISDEYLEQVYAAGACLLAASIGEGFGLPLIEAAQHKLPILARDIPVFREVAGPHACYFDGEQPADLSAALLRWRRLHDLRQHPKSDLLPWLTWQQSALNLLQTLRERRHAAAHAGSSADKLTSEAHENAGHAEHVGQTIRNRRLLLDVSVTATHDLKTGIQRVVRALLVSLLKAPPQGYQAEPVYLSDTAGQWRYWCARRYSHEFPRVAQTSRADELMDADAGDVLLLVDFTGDMVVEAERSGIYAALQARGVRIYAVVYDLLPVLLPAMFPEHAEAAHARWLDAIGKLDGAMCISKAVADDLARWYARDGAGRHAEGSYPIRHFHLGGDLSNSSPSRGVPTDAQLTLQSIQSRRSFLAVGTLEPRKGHGQVLAAFELLWQADVDVNLVLVGKEGWMVGPLAEKLRAHPQLGQRLFWLEAISDEYLEQVYAASTCLLCASEGEGFGLPLIEAAQHQLAIIARDLPVFREVAGGHAFYFDGSQAGDLAGAVESWLALHQEGRHPQSDGMPWLTWDESAAELMKNLFACITTVTEKAQAESQASAMDDQTPTEQDTEATATLAQRFADHTSAKC